LRDTSRACSPTGVSCRGAAEQWERSEARVSCSVLREAEGAIPSKLTAQERADWAYGNAVIENDRVTLEMAERAVASELDGD